ncbi:PQQ-binding-like beta-propeller repeat protein [Catenulispora sp. NF23]|uniref:outer membrane protein assembly factor BamB family protein n=1 Tax=Catenulispora pinistramenti TaxID=2705254 RepID=UPI001BAB4851|nr:PQQ-binding-like beta-propeller repeat protein [Catenulispora pinistramenti]MBS2538724.1 PQQ-binding-like beta-propeller repeat protein [Catenulispora pinistramenti]
MADPEIPEQPPQPDDTQGVSGKHNAVFAGIGTGVVALIVLVVLLSAEFSAGSNLQVLDLTTGKPIWSAPFNLIPSPGDIPDNPAGPTIEGSYLVAPYGLYDIVDIDPSTGRSVWNTKQRDEPDLGCDIDNAVIVGTDVYYGTTGSCDRSANQVWKRDTASATPATAMRLPIICNEPTVLQAGSALLTVCNASEHNPSLLLAPPGSSSFITVKASNDAFGQLAIPDRPTTLTAVYGNTLYLPDTADDIGFDGITAIDLSNGNALWTVPMSKTDAFSGLAGATSAGAVLTYWSKEHNTYAITTLAASSGAASPETAIDTKAQESSNTDLLVGDYLIGISSYAINGNDQLVAYHLS